MDIFFGKYKTRNRFLTVEQKIEKDGIAVWGSIEPEIKLVSGIPDREDVTRSEVIPERCAESNGVFRPQFDQVIFCDMQVCGFTGWKLWCTLKTADRFLMISGKNQTTGYSGAFLPGDRSGHRQNDQKENYVIIYQKVTPLRPDFRIGICL